MLDATEDSCHVGCFRFLGAPDLLSDFYSDKPIKWRFLRLTRGLGVPIFTKIDAGGDKLETWFRVQVFLYCGNQTDSLTTALGARTLQKMVRSCNVCRWSICRAVHCPSIHWSATMHRSRKLTIRSLLMSPAGTVLK